MFQDRLDQSTILTFSIDFGAYLRAYDSGVWRESFTESNYDDLPQALFAPQSTYSSDWSQRLSYSAYSYLMDRNENLRAAMLLEFLKGWDEIQRNYQYYFQEISGLDTLLKVDPKAGIRVKDGKIKIKCLEGIDLKVKYLLNLYRKIAWDDVYQRWVLPDIYRYFPMYIYLTEIRTFHSSNLTGKNQEETSITSKLGKKLLGSIGGGKISQVLGSSASSAEQLILSVMDNVVPTIKINCYMCEFVLDSWLNDSYSINNEQYEETTFEVSVRNIEIDSYYHLQGFDRFLSDQYDRVISKRALEDFPDASQMSVFNNLSFESYANRSGWLADEEKFHSYDPTNQNSQGRSWFKNFVEWGKGFVTNIVKDAINNLKTKNIIGNLSINGILTAIQSKDFVTVFGAVRQALNKKGGNSLGGPTDIVGKELLTEVIKGIAASKATSKEQQDLIDGAKDMLKDPYKIEISSNLSDEEILKRLADYQFKGYYEQSTGNDRSHATDLDGGPDKNLTSNKSNPLKADIELVPNKSNPSVPEQDLVPNIHDPKSPDTNLVENIHGGDRSIATDLDGGPDGSLTPNYNDPETPDMNLVENIHEGDRSIATDLDGGPDGSLTPNYNDPEIPSMNLIDNKNPGDRSEATDLDGGPDGDLTPNYNDPKHIEMDLIENSHEGDRSIATDLDGGPDRNLIPNYQDTSKSDMVLTENKEYTEVSSFELVPNKTEAAAGIVSLTPNQSNYENHINQLETYKAQENVLKEVSLENIMNSLNDSLNMSASTTNNKKIKMVTNQSKSKESSKMKLVDNKPKDSKPEKMKLVSNYYKGDRSLATSLDGGPSKIK